MSEASEQKAATRESCCPADSWPALTVADPGQREGQNVDIGGDMKNAYVVGNAAKCGGRGIILIHDVWGVDSGRLKGIADQFAKQGYFCVLPDLYRGDNLPEISLIKDWAKKFPYEKCAADVFDVVLPYIKKQGVESVGMIGFCWGCWLIMKLGGDERSRGIIKVGVNAHPSIRLEEMVWEKSLVAIAEDVAYFPQVLLSAGNDHDYVQEGNEYEKLLKGKDGELGKRSAVYSFKDMKHGWVNKGDVEVEEVARDVKKAITIATEALKANL